MCRPQESGWSADERRGEEKASFSSPADQDYLAFAFFAGFFAFLTAFLAFAFLAGFFLVVVFFAFFTATLRLSHLIGFENAIRIRGKGGLVKSQRDFFSPAALVAVFSSAIPTNTCSERCYNRCQCNDYLRCYYWLLRLYWSCMPCIQRCA